MRDEVAAKRVKNAWHKVRCVSKKKDADGNLVKTMSPGPTLKQWAKEQIKNSGSHSQECEVWLKNKKTLAQMSRKRK